MASKNKYTGLKKTGIILLLLLIGFTIYVIISNRNTQHMTTRQKLLKAVYPVMMWFTKTSGINSTTLSNSTISPVVSVYTLTAIGNDGTTIALTAFRGKKIMLVNTASDCGYTEQYEALEKLYRENKDRLIILGFPANDFKEQEKGTDDRIAFFCKSNFDISFPIIQKSKVVKGQGQNEIFQWLTDKNKNGWNEQAPTWNFCKYLVNENGRLTHFFAPSVAPMDNEILSAIKGP